MADRARRMYASLASMLGVGGFVLKGPGLTEFLPLVTSTVLHQGSRIVIAFIAAKLLGPETFGLWQSLYLITIYGGGVSLGIVKAMEREVPFFKGRSDLQKMGEVRQNSLGFHALGTLGLAIVLVTLGLLVGSSMGRLLILVAILFVGIQIHVYLRDYLKSDRRFNLMSGQQVSVGVLLLAAAIPLTWAFGLSGFIVGQAIAFLLAVLIILMFLPTGIRISYDWKEITRLIKIGIPIMLGGFIYLLLTTGDRLIIAGFLGTEQLGFYSLVILLASALLLIPTTVSHLIYPRMAEAYGRSGDASSLKIWVVRQFTATFGIGLVTLVVIQIWFPVFVERFLPAYTEGITAVRIVLPAFLLFLCSDGIVKFLYVIDKQVYVLLLQAVGFLLNIVLSITFVKLGWGINGVAAATASAYLGYFIMFSAVGWFFLKEGGSAQSAVGGAMR